jgi:predicted secreted protein
MKCNVRAASVASFLAIASLANVARAETPPPQGVLGLTASASVEVVKDLLSVTLSTTRDGSDANTVQAQLKQALDAAIAEAKKAARPGQLDVQTGNFSLYPRYAITPNSSRAPAITGWQGNAELIVEGRDMAAIGQLTGRITTMTIARVSHRLSREASQRVEADIVAEAIAAYRDKAASYAKLFGYGGYAVREVTVATNDSQPPPMAMMRMQATASAAAEALSVEPGKAVVTATVSGTIQMK